MDKLVEHLEHSADELGLDPSEGWKLVSGFEVDQARGCRLEERLLIPLEVERNLGLAVAAWCLGRDGFDVGAGIDWNRGLVGARIENDYDCRRGWLGRLPRRSSRIRLRFQVEVRAESPACLALHTAPPLPPWEREFRDAVKRASAEVPDEVRRMAADAGGRRANHNPFLGPGEPLSDAYSGTLRDYSGCASATDLGRLHQGVLPLGRFAFQRPGQSVDHGPELFVPDDPTGEPAIFRGALLCAPQNAGKTRLMLSWARAANAAGHNVFLIDVKGTLHQELASHLRGQLFHFTTSPHVRDCDHLNFLAGLRADDRDDMIRVRRIAEVVLPREGWESGENAHYRQNYVNWLSAMIQVLLLYRHYFAERFGEREITFGDVFAVARDEFLLGWVVLEVKEAEVRTAESNSASTDDPRHPPDRAPPPVEPGVDYWFTDLQLLFAPMLGSVPIGGRRPERYQYPEFTTSIVNALMPFSRYGLLGDKSGGSTIERLYDDPDFCASGGAVGDRAFTLDVLNDPNGPVTVILAAREQEVDAAATVASIGVRRLEQILFERMRPSTDGWRPAPVLLLLDETRRIRGFNANEYVTFARQARAGCVIVYQTLDQIGEVRKIDEILENIGTQIFLKSVSGSTARHLLRHLPERSRSSFSATASLGSSGPSNSLQIGHQDVAYFAARDLWELPAGNHPALVVHTGFPRIKPFLVDLDEDPPMGD